MVYSPNFRLIGFILRSKAVPQICASELNLQLINEFHYFIISVDRTLKRIIRIVFDFHYVSIFYYLTSRIRKISHCLSVPVRNLKWRILHSDNTVSY